jgi:mRNA-degrading endonuclease toxin of MazEF toxin-antitoxin module
MDDFKKGNVVLIFFTEQQNGQITQKRRPAVIVASLDQQDDVWVVPLTGATELKPGCVLVRQHSPEGTAAGLRLDSLVDCNVIATIPKALVVNKIGQLSDETMERVTEELRKKGNW